MDAQTRERWLAINYAATIFTSAFLLFQVQPLISKHILPWFGGSPTVWTTCMLFFQSMLLAGYVYVHLSQHRLRPAHQALAQLMIIAAAALGVLVIGVLPGEGWESQANGDPVGRILLMLAVSVGLPFFVLSTTAPLIQAWFVRSSPGGVPYRFYALSNLGSLLALVSYPLVFERRFDLPRQAWLWSWGFLAYAVLCGIAAVRLWREGAKAQAAVDENPAAETRATRQESPTWRQRTLWLVLPAFSSVAFLATTNHVCTDMAVMPLLWVVPLGLYLLSFIIAFDHPRWYRRTLLAALTLAAIYGAAVVSRSGPGQVELFNFGMTGRCLRMAAETFAKSLESPQYHVSVYSFLGWNLAAMFGVCLLCHGELYRQRPHPRYLTSFYLLVAAGGVLGGVGVTLVAPHLFRTYFEWQLFMFFGCVWAATLILHQLVQAAFPAEPNPPSPRRSPWLPLAALLVLLVPTSLMLLDLAEYLQVSDIGTKLRTRNFFGTLAVRERNVEDPKLRSMFLYHGTTAHGSQFSDADRRGQPTTYYGTTSGVGRTLNFFRRKSDGGLRIGAVGLGTGTLAAYVGDGDSITFYEINPAVIELTESGRWFTYLQDCRSRGGDYRIRLGDARLVLKRELQTGARTGYHMLVLDAFSGDAIPAHLLTEEAFEVYLQCLSTGSSDGVEGALAVHTSNRYLELEPVVRGAAAQFGLSVASVHSSRDPKQGIYASEWNILTRNGELLEALAPFAETSDESSPPPLLWTDDRSNLLDVIKR